MMVLQHPSRSTGSSVMQKAALRRKRSKGTIVAYGNESNTKEATELAESHASVASNATTTSQPQHTSEATHAGGPAKPCHSARLALMCVKNAHRMGARVHLFLCPPGRVRRELQTALRQKARGGSPGRRLLSDAGGYYGLEKLVGQDALVDYDMQEEDFLLRANTYDEDSDEEASSGDEDDMSALAELFSEESATVDEQVKYLQLREPLFVSAGSDSNPNGAPMAAMGPGAPGKLPFNWRKIRYFDLITATDSANARAYLKEELRRSKLREALILTRHLKKIQREERRKKKIEKGEPIDEIAEKEAEANDEKAVASSSVEPFTETMTTAASAALLIESLCVNPFESLEGLGRCYDGIVAAGVALLDSAASETTSLQTTETKSKASRSEIISALTPLLITSLEHSSGEVILLLAKLRRTCATARYQRRFVQRVAPCLIRPPKGAMWCLKHQNDMEAILAAAELIFDSAFDIFSKGWYERGRLLLADSKRAKTLDSAAAQLRSLSSEPPDGLALALPGKGNRRRLTTKARVGDSGDSLAEWEVMAVDRQIRVSISHVLTMDWSRTVVHSDIPKPHNRRATMSNSMKRISTLPQPSSTENSPKAGSPATRSPSRVLAHKTPHSPPHMPTAASFPSQTDVAVGNIFSPSFVNQSGASNDRPHSPPNPSLLPLSPPAVQRTNSKESEVRTQTPPRSPKSPVRSTVVADFTRGAEQPPMPSVVAPSSPKRKAPILAPREVVGSVTPTQSLTTPLSPSSVGTTGSGEIVSYRPNPSSSSVSSSGSAIAAHYRMLTSTPAERKRTVAACRALRAQIQRFEDAFVQLHGRPPKGPADRAPLASTYSQYREWKRAIRADAASRIQALLRGASTRSKLLRLNNPRITRVVMKRAGRAKSTEVAINDISIPVEIGRAEERMPGIQPVAASPEWNNHAAPSLAPTWASRVVRRRNGSDRDNLPTPTTSSPFPPTATPPPVPSSGTNDITYLSLGELQNRKRDLKQQLKQYDMNFARRHGRMPVKAEKEPIRHLYESYNALKSQITRMEREGRQQTHQPQPQQHQLVAPSSPVTLAASTQSSQRNVSPTSGSDSGHSGEESPVRGGGVPPSRQRRKFPRSTSPTVSSVSSASTASAPSGPPPSQDLAALKTEKSRLHQMLRDYEKDFFRDHNRQVSSFADIRPVASQYRRYKEIKRAIAAYQQREQG